jgi:hypothetical protein
MDEAGFKQFIAAQLFESLMKSFPEETRHTVKMLGSWAASCSDHGLLQEREGHQDLRDGHDAAGHLETARLQPIPNLR